MMQAIWVGLSALLVALFLPSVVVEPLELPADRAMLVIESVPENKEMVCEETMVQISSGQGVLELPLEQYLTGVVLSEMPVSFEPEALKAQAVAARTFTMRQMEGGKHTDCDLCTDSSCCQAWNSQETFETKLGAHWLQYWEKAETAVRQTAGQVLTYGGQLIEAVYFSCSGGATEDAVAVWGSEVPYLQSVSSKGEEEASKYYTETVLSLERFCALLQAANAEVQLNGSPNGWFGPVEKTEGGGIKTMEIGGQPFTGTELRTLFGLNSTSFSVEITQESIVFQVYGYGHRVGMSQYGANAMAKEGKSYQEILQHYYTGVELETRTSNNPVDLNGTP